MCQFSPTIYILVVLRDNMDDCNCLFHFSTGADQERLDIDTKKLQSFVKDKSLVIAEKGALAGRFGADTVKSLVSLTDTPKSGREGRELVQGPEVKYQLG